MRILVLNGPNLNMLGVREPELYGERSYKQLKRYIKSFAKEKGVEVSIAQYNCEGRMVSAIQKAREKFDWIVINAAALTHTSVAVLDALKAVGLPTVEVHLTDISNREEFRAFSYVSLYATKVIKNRGFDGYIDAIKFILEKSN